MYDICRLQTAHCRLQNARLKIEGDQKYRNEGGVNVNITLFQASNKMRSKAQKRSLYFPCKLHRPHSQRSGWLYAGGGGGSIKSPWRIANSILEMGPDECNFVLKMSTLFPGYFLTFLEAWKRCYIFDDVTFIRRFLVSFNLQSAVCCLRSGLQSAVCKCHTPRFCRLYSV